MRSAAATVRRYGEDNVEISYSDASLQPRTLVVARPEVNAKLSELISEGVTFHGFKEVIPRMNDIFIKLVTEGV